MERRLLFAAGDVDLTFGGHDGVVSTFPRYGQELADTALAPDGRIVAAGGRSIFTVVRYNADGGLDHSFGGGAGYVVVESQALSNAECRAVAVLPDNRILVAGQARDDFALLRLNPDGSLDPTFGPGGADGDGVVTTDFGGGYDFATAMAVLPDGKVLLAGSANGQTGRFDPGDFAVARYLADGTLDATFGAGGADGDGRVSLDFAGRLEAAADLAVLPDGKIVLGGTSTPAGASDETDGSFAAARFNPDGTPDATFGAGGPDGDARVTTRFAEFDRGASGNAVAVQADGKVLLGGDVRKTLGGHGERGGAELFTGYQLGIVRYNLDGTLDTSFGGGDGLATGPESLSLMQNAVDLAVLGDGSILAGGTHFQRSSLAAVRFDADGVLDVTFGTEEGVARVIHPSDESQRAADLLPLPDGRFILAGTEAFRRFALARFDAAGRVDTTFDPGDGQARIDSERFDNGGTAFAVAPDGSVLAGGAWRPDGSPQLSVVRYRPDGILDAAFGAGGPDGDGVATADFGSGQSITSIAVAPDGKVVASTETTLVRFNPDGTLDTTFGAGGIVVMSPEAFRRNIRRAAVAADGKVVVAGFDRPAVGVATFYVARFNADGSADTTFDGDGAVTTAFGYSGANTLALLPDGRILAGGFAQPEIGRAGEGQAALARYNPDGSLDPSFGGDGTITTDIDPVHADQASDLAPLPGGGFVAVVSGVLVRYREDGSLETSFGDGGIARFALVNVNEEARWSEKRERAENSANALAVQSDGKLVVVAGAAPLDTPSDLSRTAVLRFLPDGRLDETFNNGGKFEGSGWGRDVGLQPGTGRILVGNGQGFQVWALQGDPAPEPPPPPPPPPPPAPNAVPTAWAVSVPGVSTAGVTSTTFAILYDDDVALDPSTFDNNDVRVVGPDGTSSPAEFVRIEPPTGEKAKAVSYRFTRPGGGAFTAADYGRYTLVIEPDQVRDLAGLPVAAGQPRDGSFVVDVPAGDANLGGSPIRGRVPATVVAGAGARRAILAFPLRNHGTARAAGTIAVTFLASADPLPDAGDLPLATVRKRIGLGRGRSEMIRATVRNFMAGVPAGDWFVVARIDAENAIPERVESDNFASTSRAIHVAEAPAALAPRALRRLAVFGARRSRDGAFGLFGDSTVLGG